MIKETQFTSGLTNKTYHTRSWDDLRCKSYNVVYGVECSLCGLIYVGETKGQLRNRMSGRRYRINHGSNQLLYQHFNLPDHSILSFKVRILEKIYHPTNKPSLSTPLRRLGEGFWIRELGTAAPYGCNDKIDSVENLTSPRCSSFNVMGLFGSSQRRKRNHGHRHYNHPNFHADVAFDTLLPYVHQPLGLHHTRTKLYQLPVTKLRSLQKEVVDTKTYIQNSPEYKLVAIILDVAKFRLYKPVQTFSPEETPTRDFLKLDFRNKNLDAVNISNILNHKKVTSTIPAYFKKPEPTYHLLQLFVSHCS